MAEEIKNEKIKSKEEVALDKLIDKSIKARISHNNELLLELAESIKLASQKYVKSLYKKYNKKIKEMKLIETSLLNNLKKGGE